MEDNNHVYISKVNEVYLKLKCEKHISQEISEFFTFFVPGYQFVPAFRNRIWDGKIRLLDLRTNQIYIGLIKYLQEFCESRDYTIGYSQDSAHLDIEDDFSVYHAKKFADNLQLSSRGKKIEIRDHQVDAFCHAMQTRRALLLSPTASGKSLIIYLIVRQLMDYQKLK